MYRQECIDKYVKTTTDRLVCKNKCIDKNQVLKSMQASTIRNRKVKYSNVYRKVKYRKVCIDKYSHLCIDKYSYK